MVNIKYSHIHDKNEFVIFKNINYPKAATGNFFLYANILKRVFLL